MRWALGNTKTRQRGSRALLDPVSLHGPDEVHVARRDHLEKHGERVSKTLFDAIECLRHFWTLYGVYKTLFDTI